MLLMTLKLYAATSILLLILAAPLSVQDVNASHFKFIKGKLNDATELWPSGGEEVGSFKMKFINDRLSVLKIEMKKPPRDGYQYIVGFMDALSGLRVLKANPDYPFGASYSYSSDGRVIVMRELSHINHIYDLLLVNENDFSRSLDGKRIAVASLPDPTNLNPKHDKLEHSGAILVSTIDLQKQEYEVGERIEVDPKLLNMGNETITVMTRIAPYMINVYSPKGNLVETFSCAILDAGGFLATIEPLGSWTLQDESVPEFYRNTLPKNCYDIRIDKAGEYLIITYWYTFLIVENGTVINEKEADPFRGGLYSKPVAIRVLP